MQTLYISLIMISALVMASVMVPLMLYFLRRAAAYAEVNERTNHESPVPTGVGFGLIIVAAGFMVIGHAPEAIIAGMLAMSVTGLIDDLKGLSVRIRLGMQAAVVAYGLTALTGSVFQGLLPSWAEYAVLGLAWLWMINLTNFMDGIDEITAGNTITLCLGLVLVTMLHAGSGAATGIDAGLILVCLLAFYPYNRHPAHCFLGDAGSLPLGFVTGYLLFHLAGEGLWEAALILPAYYLTDATLTLLARGLRGEKVWKAHSEHFYQKAVRRGWTHAQVAHRVIALNLLMVVLAVATLYMPSHTWGLVVVAYLGALALCLQFRKVKFSGMAHAA
jgi:UDP-N-acetylmuramyl pentapeptide phosphotransferase/UDP-N-acetylglucosamine-1-phosphate transferase